MLDRTAYQREVAERWRKRQQMQPQPYLNTGMSNQPDEMMDLGLMMARLKAAEALASSPSAPPMFRQMAEQLKQKVQSMLQSSAGPTTPFGFNFMTGKPNTGPFSPGNNYQTSTESRTMNPEHWGEIQQMNSPKTAQIYDNYNQRSNEIKNYLDQGLRDQRYPDTFMSDPNTGKRSYQINSQDVGTMGKRAGEQAKTQQYLDSLPPWALKDMGIANGKYSR